MPSVIKKVRQCAVVQRSLLDSRSTSQYFHHQYFPPISGLLFPDSFCVGGLTTSTPGRSGGRAGGGPLSSPAGASGRAHWSPAVSDRGRRTRSVESDQDGPLRLGCCDISHVYRAGLGNMWIATHWCWVTLVEGNCYGKQSCYLTPFK